MKFTGESVDLIERKIARLLIEAVDSGVVTAEATDFRRDVGKIGKQAEAKHHFEATRPTR
jgi:hypothetical protein